MLDRSVKDVKQCPRFILAHSALHHFPGSSSSFSYVPLLPPLSSLKNHATESRRGGGGEKRSLPKLNLSRSIVLIKREREREEKLWRDKGCGLIKILPRASVPVREEREKKKLNRYRQADSSTFRV